ncbi:MAG: hypothetical protein DRJ43_06415 [Thermoprotei archaeon]|nr:MAG: hypothetical protein DRJ43_06415 [Thermoprotei archaeon]
MNDLLKIGKLLAMMLKGEVYNEKFRVTITSKDCDIVIYRFQFPLLTRILIYKPVLVFAIAPFRDEMTIKKMRDVRDIQIGNYRILTEFYYLFENQAFNEQMRLVETIWLEVKAELDTAQIFRLIFQFL